MIQVFRMSEYSPCYCCGTAKDVKSIYFRQNFAGACEKNGAVIALCDDCRRELAEKMDERRKDGGQDGIYNAQYS